MGGCGLRIGIKLVAVVCFLLLCNAHSEDISAAADELSAVDGPAVFPAALGEKLRRFHLSGLDTESPARQHHGKRVTGPKPKLVVSRKQPRMGYLQGQLEKLQTSEESIKKSIDGDPSLDPKHVAPTVTQLDIPLFDAGHPKATLSTASRQLPHKSTNGIQSKKVVVASEKTKITRPDGTIGMEPAREADVTELGSTATLKESQTETQAEKQAKTADELRSHIKQMKQSEEAISEERQYAEKMLKGAIKSGKNNDLTVARQMMTDVQRKTALSTLQNMGYQCQRSNADFKNSTASNSTKKASVPKPTATVKNGTQIEASMETTVVLLEDDLNDEKKQDPTLAAYEKVAKTNEKLEDFENQIVASKDAIAIATAKTKKVHSTARSRAITVSKDAKEEVQQMRSEMEKMKKEHALLKNMFASKKITDAQDYVKLVQGQLKTGKAGIADLKAEGRKLKEKAKAEEDIYTNEKEATDQLKEKSGNAGVESMSTKADEVFAEEMGRNQDAAAFKAKQGSVNAKNMKRLLKESVRKLKIPRGKYRRADAAYVRLMSKVRKAEGIHAGLSKALGEGKRELEEAKKENAAMFKQKFMAGAGGAGGASYAPTQMSASKATTEADVEENGDKKNDQEEALAKARKALRKVVKSGDQGQMADAEALLVKADPTMKSSDPVKPKQELKPCDSKKDGNSAKCAGESHGSSGGKGKLTCKPKKGTCPDNIGGNGMFVLTKADGEGFCSPWYDASENTTALEFVYKSADRQDKVIGDTYFTKSTVAHPEGANPKVGMIIFKRTVCHGEKCQEYKIGKCIQCEEDVFKSVDPKTDVLKFLKSCALPLLKKHGGGPLPKKNACKGSDLVKANRMKLGF